MSNRIVRLAGLVATLLALLVACSSGESERGSPTPSAGVPSPSAGPTATPTLIPTPATSPTVLLTLSGSGQATTPVFDPRGAYRVGYAINCMYSYMSANSLEADDPAAKSVPEVGIEDFDVSGETPVRGSVVGHATIPIYLLITTDRSCNWALVVTQGSRASTPPPIPARQSTPP